MTKQLFRGLALFAALALMLCGCTAKPAADSGKDYLATEFGAVADGVTLNTASVQAAIDYISANGGGRLVFTPGTFVCGSIYLKNNVTLHLQKDAVLLGSLNPWDFIRDPVAHWTAFVLSVDQENIGVTGEGTLDCRGFQVANNLVQYVHLGLLEDPLGLDRVQEVKRPELIHFFRCKNIVMKDITLKDPASWTQQYDQCDGLLVEGMKVDAKCYWNNDGIDVVDSKNVTIRNCYIDSADDSYCFKSHSASGVSENILVENCIGRSSANGVKFGTYTRGTFKHFRFKNIKIFDTYRSAFTVASVDGASIEDVEIDLASPIDNIGQYASSDSLRGQFECFYTFDLFLIQNVIFVRINPETGKLSFDKGNAWNKTADLRISDLNGVYTINGWELEVE